MVLEAGGVFHLAQVPIEHFDYKGFVIMELFDLYSPGYTAPVLDFF